MPLQVTAIDMRAGRRSTIGQRPIVFDPFTREHSTDESLS